MRTPTPDEHWSLYSGDARQVRVTLQQYLVDCKTVVEHQLGNSSDTQEMMRLQGERRVLERLLEAFQKDPRKTSPLSRDLGGLKVTA